MGNHQDMVPACPCLDCSPSVSSFALKCGAVVVKGFGRTNCCHIMILVMVVLVLMGLEVMVIELLMGGTVKGYMVLAKMMFS